MTDQPTPETDAKLDSGPLGPGDWLAYARALEIQRNAARAERDEARNALTGNLWSEWETERAATLGRLAAAQHAVALLRAALDEYGEHQGVCPKKYHGMKDARPCTCGLDEALNQAAQ
jgi:hypothetical protein